MDYVKHKPLEMEIQERTGGLPENGISPGDNYHINSVQSATKLLSDTGQQMTSQNMTSHCSCAPIDDVVIINVGGIRHEVLRETLRKVPNTLLTDLNNVQNHFRQKSNEYYFDRHPAVFSAVLNFYRTKELHLPQDVCNFM